MPSAPLREEKWFYVNDFEFGPSSASKGGPEAVSEINAVVGENGNLEATISFKLPVKNLNDETLTDNMKAVVKSSVEEKTVKGEVYIHII